MTPGGICVCEEESAWKNHARKRKRPNSDSAVDETKLMKRTRLFLFLFFGLVALLADLVFLRRIFAARMGAFLALGDRFVATGSILLAFFASFLLFVRSDAALVVTFFACCLGFDTTALTRKDRTGTDHEGHRKSQSRQRFG